jgi:hypothetical protein
MDKTMPVGLLHRIDSSISGFLLEFVRWGYASCGSICATAYSQHITFSCLLGNPGYGYINPDFAILANITIHLLSICLLVRLLD